MKTVIVKTVLFLFLFASVTGCNDDDDSKELLTLRAVGAVVGQPIETTIEGVGIKVSGNAFHLNLFDYQTGEFLGSVKDINVDTEVFDDGSMKGENYTIFTFSDDNSTLVLHNFIDMTPVNEVTLAAVIQPKNTISNIIGGTGRFAGVTGGSTLEATLDITGLALGSVAFDCTYGMTVNR